MTFTRFVRGASSALGALLFPLGRFWYWGIRQLRSEERMQQGCTFVLPGIEGRSFLNIGIVQGLADGGVQSAIEIFDWTTGLLPLFLYHLRGKQRNQRQAARLAQRIVDYQIRYPDCPVHLVGHSGGAGMALLTLEALPPGRTVSSVVLLAAAVSPQYPVRAALARTDHGIWNITSIFDALFLGAGELLCGTIDGRHCIAAGACGFKTGARVEDRPVAAELHECPFRMRMLLRFNFGGHFGCVNRLFVADAIAPLLRNGGRGATLP